MPEGCVIDTDVISYLFRRDTRAEYYRPLLTGRLLAVSFMDVPLVTNNQDDFAGVEDLRLLTAPQASS